MKISGLFAALTALLSTGVDARNLGWLPKATQSVVLPLHGMIPKPTPPPGIHELVRRQDEAPLTIVVAPDNTCGYISEDPSIPWHCSTSSTCGLVPSQRISDGYILCLDANGQPDFGRVKFECVDYNAFYTLSACDSSCSQDSHTLKCIGDKKYCKTIAFPGALRITCALVLTTRRCTWRSRPSAARMMAGIIPPPTVTVPTKPTTVTVLNTKQTSNSNVGGPTASAAPSAPASESSGGGTPVGAIVGGVVGGVAAIGIAGIALFFFLRNKKKTQGLQEKTASPQGHPQNMMPGQHQSSYDPKFGGAEGYQSLNQQYPEGPPSPGGFRPQQSVIHEAPNQTSENHRGQMQELA
ncbi:hypothetical protein TOPH_00888 [Tolypocladium ophioglossoides CBS 100239]|uniref:Carcinoembryonic antigen-related cell adhesion molecule 1 n=1 Tax=Tolypocladium ophioglossoides (strain CBS 100239) TaxID=1163406 RepID=A0A0L0NK88_TOLOC|nr:hypothetical protein TOPH_00888 [Tolypocladium ophioglossoides CBS 100239]